MARHLQEFVKVKPLVDYFIALSTLDVFSGTPKSRLKIISLLVSHSFYSYFLYIHVKNSIHLEVNINLMWTFLVWILLSDYIAIMFLNIFKRKNFHVLLENIKKMFEEEEEDEELGGILEDRLMTTLRIFNFLNRWEIRLGVILTIFCGINFRFNPDYGLTIEIPFIVSEHILWQEGQYIIQIIFGTVTAYNMMSINMAISFLGLSIIAEFNILTDYMKVLNEKIKTDPKFFRKIIRRHCSFIENVDVINEIISESSFLQLFANCVIFLFGFSFVMRHSYTFANYMIIFAGLMLSIHVCVLGHILKMKTDRLSDSLYLTNWYDLSLDDQKTFLIILGMAQREYGLKAAGMYDVNLYTIIQVCLLDYLKTINK
uniref:Odorant receptor n=1 Tax=Lutzomyia longipalpis TaxID=7200 RepID=A0A7G3AES1_LUTLO